MSNAIKLRLDGELTIYSAQETRQLLLHSLAELAQEPAPATLEIDVSGVSEIDTAGMQLLMAARQHAREQGKDIRLAGQGASVTEVIALLGLGDYFSEPAAPAAHAA
jgi:anti-anti-sigma factor